MSRAAMICTGVLLASVSLLGPACGGDHELTLEPMVLPWADHGAEVAMSEFVVPGSFDDQGFEPGGEAWEIDCLALEDVGGALPISYAVVQVTPDQVTVSGHRVVDVDDGRVDEHLMRGNMIEPLYATMQAMADSAKASAATHSCPSDALPGDFNGKLLLAIDARVPFSTLRQVMYTCGQAQFGDFYFLVDDGFTGEQVQWTASGRSRNVPLMLTIAITDEGFLVAGNDEVVLPSEPFDPSQDLGARRQPTLPCAGPCLSSEDYDWAGLRRLLSRLKERHPAETNAIVIPETAVTTSTLLRTMDVCQWDDANRSLFPFVVVAGGANGGGSHRSGTSAQATGRQQTLSFGLHSTLAAIASSLPAIGAPRASSEFLDDRIAEPPSVAFGSAEELRAQRKTEMMQQGLAALIGTTGEGAGGDAVADLLADGGNLGASIKPEMLTATGLGSRTAGRSHGSGRGGRSADSRGETEPASQASMRAWFPESFVFEPLVVTDEDGVASLDVVVPDQLTTWRLLGLAHSQAGSQAGAEHLFASTLPAYVEVTAPPLLRVGDRLRLPLQVVNNSPEPYGGRLEAKAIGEGVRGQTSATVGLAAYAAEVRTLRLDAVAPGVATVVASLGGDDAVQRSLRIVPAGRPSTRTASGTLAAPRTLELPAREGAARGSSTLELVVYPGPLAVVRAEMEQAPSRGSDLASIAYATALVGRGQQVAASMQAEVDPTDLRADRLRAYQLLVRHTRSPSTEQALLALRGAAQLDDPMTRTLAKRLAGQLADAQSPDGSFAVAWGSGEVSVERALVFVAEAADACAELDDRVPRRSASFVTRNAAAVRDPHTAAVLLGANLVGEPQRASLRQLILDAVVERDDGSRIVRPTDASRRGDGTRPGEMETTARAIVALQDDGDARELLADLATTVLSSYRRGYGFGDGLASLAALDALAVMFDEPLPAEVEVRLFDGETELAVRTLDLSSGTKPLVVSVAAPAGERPLRLEASPAVPGLIYTLTRTDWLGWDEPSTDGFALRVATPDRLRVGRPGEIQLQAAVPGDEPFVVTLELPAGLEVDEQSLEPLTASGTLTRFEIEQGKVTLYVPGQPAGASFGLQLDGVPTLAGSLQWGAATLALLSDPARQVQIQPAALQVAP